MVISNYNEKEIIAEYKDVGIGALAEKYNLTYNEVRLILKLNGVKVSRGRKRGSGIGQCTESNGKRVDRRKAWQIRKMEAGECTSCGGPNDSGSIYHCKKCLKKRTDAKKVNKA